MHAFPTPRLLPLYYPLFKSLLVFVPIRVLRLAAVKALKDMQAVWERVLVPHCREFSTPIASLWQDITATSTSLTDDLALLDIQPKININNEKEMDDEADTNSDTDSDDDSEKDEFLESDGADDEAHDGFLEQWEENLDPIINSLYKVIDIKEDDTNKEKDSSVAMQMCRRSLPRNKSMP